MTACSPRPGRAVLSTAEGSSGRCSAAASGNPVWGAVAAATWFSPSCENELFLKAFDSTASNCCDCVISQPLFNSLRYFLDHIGLTITTPL